MRYPGQNDHKARGVTPDEEVSHEEIVQREIARGIEQLGGDEKAPLDVVDLKRKARELWARRESEAARCC